MKHITPLQDDEPTDAELAGKPDSPPRQAKVKRIACHRGKSAPVVVDDVMRSPTPEQIRSAH